MKKMKLLKLALCAFALATTSAWAGSQSWTRSNPGSQVSYFTTVATTQFTTVLYGGIPAGGTAVAVDITNGQAVSVTSIDIPQSVLRYSLPGGGYAYAPGGSPFGGVYHSGTAPAGVSMYLYQEVHVNGSGGYATSLIEASW